MPEAVTEITMGQGQPSVRLKAISMPLAGVVISVVLLIPGFRIKRGAVPKQQGRMSRPMKATGRVKHPN